MTRKIISAILALFLCCALAVSAFAATQAHIYDDANLLTDAEEAWLTDKLADLSSQYEAQIVIATVDTIDGGNIDWYLEYLYDGMGFGYGENRDGVLLLVCMDLREYRILSNGYAGVAIDPNDIDAIGDAIVDDLSYGDYGAAFDKFADRCAYYLDGYRNGFPFDAKGNLVICLVIGLIAGLVVSMILKGQLKSVSKQAQAHNYIKSGSMQLTARQDIYLYRNVTRTPKATNNSSRGGGGGSRSTGGGRF